jgi:hypothetical protein
MIPGLLVVDIRSWSDAEVSFAAHYDRPKFRGAIAISLNGTFSILL